MKRLSKQIAYQAAYGDECFVLDKEAVKEYIADREKITEAAKVQGVYSDVERNRIMNYYKNMNILGSN